MGSTLNQQNLSHTEYTINTEQQRAAIKELNYLISQRQWHVNFREYTGKKWKKILPLIKKTDIAGITFQEINSPQPLYQFIHIDFHSLTRLQMKNVHLYSLQQLAKLNAPLLESLHLGLCPIRQKRIEQSVFFLFANCIPLIQQIQDFNYIMEGDCLTECNFSAQMELISIFSPHNTIIPQNYNWLVKMKNKQLYNLEYYSTKVIQNGQMKSIIKKRFPQIRLIMRYDRIQ